MTVQEKIQAIIANTDHDFAPYYDVLPTLIKERGFTRGIEIGVFAGGHSEAMLKDTDLKLLVGIDPYAYYVHGGAPGSMDSQEEYDCLFEEVKKRLDFGARYYHFKLVSDKAWCFMKTEGWGMFDFVFIDGYHTYSQVKKDLDNYSKKIKKGGVIACHDYNHSGYPGVAQAIDEFAGEHKAKIVECPLYMIYMEKTWE